MSTFTEIEFAVEAALLGKTVNQHFFDIIGIEYEGDEN